MISQWLYKLTAKLPCKLITLDSGPYLERYYLGQLFGATFYLHRFISSDSNDGLHNHPWRWGRSLILSGSYIEERVFDLCPDANISGCMTENRHIRWWNVVNANTFHRIYDAEPNTWVLFFHSERVMIRKGMASVFKGWGFIKSLEGSGTLFVSFPSKNSQWWIKAPKGREAGRVSHENRG